MKTPKTILNARPWITENNSNIYIYISTYQTQVERGVIPKFHISISIQMWLIFVLIICLKEKIDKNKKNPQQTNKHAYHKNKLILRVQ